MNNDLISREALANKIGDWFSVIDYRPEVGQDPFNAALLETRNEVIAAVLEEIKNAPVVDAEPVRLRVVISDIDTKKGWYEKSFFCSCDRIIKTEMWDHKYCFGYGTALKNNETPQYCPFCGAKMFSIKPSADTKEARE